MTLEKDIERKIEKNATLAVNSPWKFFGKWILIIVAVLIILSIVGWLWSAGQVIGEEFTPREIKAEFENFQQMKGDMDNKKADINLHIQRLEIFLTMNGDNMSKWSRFIQDDYLQITTELTGLIQSYNRVCNNYNVKMSIWYDKLFNLGEDPDYHLQQYGLQKEYGEYIYEFPL